MGKPGLCTRWFFFWEQYFALHISMNKCYIYPWINENELVKMCVFWMFLWACLPNNCFGVFCQPQYSICVDFNSILFADFESDFSTYSYIGWNKSNGKIFKSNTLKFKIRVILFSSWNHVHKNSIYICLVEIVDRYQDERCYINEVL